MRFLIALMAVAATLTATPPALAQGDAYPNKTVRIVVGYAAGGATDILARLLAQKMTESLGQQVIVDNRPGANSNIGAEVVAKAAPDGYTVYMGSIANTINMSLYPKLNYDVVKDFSPVMLVATVPNILVVHPSVPAKTVKELIDLAKAKPDTLNVASSGSGSSIHMSAELFKMLTGVKITHVPYKGSAPAVSDLLGGQVQMMFDNAPSAMPHVKAGKLRALAVTSPRRIPALPDVPTVIESGVAGFDVFSWFALFVPAGTPKEIVAKLNAHANQALAKPDVQARMADLGAESVGGTTERLASHVNAEVARWSKVVKESGARAD
jgi:tripartite-type tricarboxylate transporter receptor subunit TctC